MMRLHRIVPLLGALLLAACAGTATPPQPPPVTAATERQVLVMLRQVPPHFRPDMAYGASYTTPVAREARRRLARPLAQEYGLRRVGDWPMPSLAVDCYLMQVTGDQMPAALVARLRNDRRVESVQALNLFRSLGHDDPLYPLQPAARLWHLGKLHETATGRGIRVAVVDSGVDTGHPDLAGQIETAANFVDGTAYAAERHGTAVAGIIAAVPDNRIGIAGVAPAARLMALRACWPEHEGRAAALCSSFTLAKAIEFAIDRGAQVINLSLGGPKDPLLERLIDAALAQGIAVVGAADPAAADGGFPASHRGVIAVADVETPTPAGRALAAPGSEVPTTVPGGRWDFVSGSSFAAAHVSGLVALLDERVPGIAPARIRDALMPDGPRLAAEGSPPPIIDACAALHRATGRCVCGCERMHEAGLLRP